MGQVKVELLNDLIRFRNDLYFRFFSPELKDWKRTERTEEETKKNWES